MIQKLQTFTNFNNMNKFLPKARTALLSTVAAAGLGLSTTFSSCSQDPNIKNVSPDLIYKEYTSLTNVSINTEEAIKNIEKQIISEQYDTNYYNILNINPNLANSKTTLRDAIKLKHDILVEQYNRNINRLNFIKSTDKFKEIFDTEFCISNSSNDNKQYKSYNTLKGVLRDCYKKYLNFKIDSAETEQAIMDIKAKIMVNHYNNKIENQQRDLRKNSIDKEYNMLVNKQNENICQLKKIRNGEVDLRKDRFTKKLENVCIFGFFIALSFLIGALLNVSTPMMGEQDGDNLI